MSMSIIVMGIVYIVTGLLGFVVMMVIMAAVVGAVIWIFSQINERLPAKPKWLGRGLKLIGKVLMITFFLMFFGVGAFQTGKDIWDKWL